MSEQSMQGVEAGTSAAKLQLKGGIRIAFWLCVVIGAAAVLRRVFAILLPPRSAPPQLMALDAYFSAHAHLTLTHILLALTFVLIVPLVVLKPSRISQDRAKRPERFDTPDFPASGSGAPLWAERAMYPLGLAVSLTAYAMSVHAVGGWLERSAVLVFNTWFLISLTRAFVYFRRGDAWRNREWLLRAVFVLLGVATTRPIMGIFFATSQLTHLTPQQFFGIAFWLGWSINTFGIEWWLRRRRKAPTAEKIA